MTLELSSDLINLLVMATVMGGLTAAQVRSQGIVGFLKSRDASGWFLDLANLTVQGTLIPLLQGILVSKGLEALLPELHGSLAIGPAGAFLLCMVGVDYAYYWNHRLLHKRWLWALHQTHHSAPHMDAWMSSRNTIWTSLLIVYLWLNGVLIHITGERDAVLLAVTITGCLDLWRHSGMKLHHALERLLSCVLVTPTQHAWHHSSHVVDINFGANFNLWDRLHGTYLPKTGLPARIGVPAPGSLLRQLIHPWPRKSP
jgi:sterol desaturase/sphingolipid hydroxylase (fatty acid hydroxylase superfamily)